MKSNTFVYYITLFIIWIILILGILYLYTNISSTLYWNTQVQNIYEQFNNLQNHWTPTTGPLDRRRDLYFECTHSQGANGKGYTFGCKWGK
jgi:hypothetical protein